MIERRSCTIDAAAWRRDLSYLKRSILDCQSSAALQRINQMLDDLESFPRVSQAGNWLKTSQPHRRG